MKRSICIACIIGILAGMLPMFGALADTDTVFSSDYGYAEDFLTKIGVISNGDTIAKKAAEESVTRAEYALMVYRSYNGNLAYDGGSFFTDLVAGSQESQAINALAQAGIFNGVGDGEFYPDGEILMCDAVAVMLRCMGYQNVNNQTNPVFAPNVCAKYDLLPRKAFDNNTSRKDVIINALYTLIGEQMFDMTDIELSDKGTGYRYSPTADTMLSNYFGIYKTEGILNSNGVVDISGNEADAKIAIVDKTFIKITEPVNIDVGMDVTAYYTGENEKLFFAAYPDIDNERIILSALDIAGYSDYTYEYYDGTKIRKITLNPIKTTFIYNNMPLTSSAKSYMLPEYGRIIFTDNNGDGKYEVVDIKSYESFVVEWVSRDNDCIVISGRDHLVYADDNEPCIVRNYNGEADNADNIAVGMTVSCAVTEKDGKKLAKEIIMSDKKLRHAIDSTEDQNGKLQYIYIDGVKYNILPGNENLQNSLAPTGESNDLYLDFMDTIVDISYTAGLSNIAAGYLVEAGYSDKGLNKRSVLRIYDEIGRLKDYDCAKKVTLNGKIESNAIYQLVREAEGQIILFSLNENDEICYIDTATPLTDSLTVTSDDKLIKAADDNNEGNGRGLHYSQSTMCFGGRIYLSTNTLMFGIPQSPKTADESDFYMMDPSMFEDGNYYLVQSYTTNPDSPVADVLVVSDNMRVKGSRNNIAVVTSIGTARNSEGEETYSIHLVERLGEYTFVVKKKSVLDTALTDKSETDTTICKIQKGDLIKYRIDKNGEMDCALMVYDKSEDTLMSTLTISNSYTYGSRTISVIPYDICSGYVKVADYARKDELDSLGMNDFEYISFARIAKTFLISRKKNSDTDIVVTDIAPSEIKNYKDNGVLNKAIVNVVNQNRTTIFIYEEE